MSELSYTSTASDTTTPSWNETIAYGLSTSTLLEYSQYYLMYEDDGDYIGGCWFQLLNEHFDGSPHVIECPRECTTENVAGFTVTFRLLPY